MIIVLLSGGSGSRLWPLSNSTRSKQFLKVLKDDNNAPESMVQRTYRLIRGTFPDAQIVIAASESQAQSIEHQLSEQRYHLILEPERRNTAPAIFLSCAYLRFSLGIDDDEPIMVLPIDAFADQSFYKRLQDLEELIRVGDSELSLIGVKPNHPSEKYGYIVPESAASFPCSVKQFVEKPSLPLARKLIAEGALWNCGVFGFQLGLIAQIAQSYFDFKSFEEAISQYQLFPKISFDYEVVEKSNSIKLLDYEGIWKDLGTWNTLTEEMSNATSGRVAIDEATVSNVHTINETNLPMVVSGIHDSVIIATPDGILVSGKEESTGIKPFVESIADIRPMCEKRRWGEYRVIDYSICPDKSKMLVKELIIYAGKQISYQKHSVRSETWAITSGYGEVVIDGEVFEAAKNSSFSIMPGQKHSVRAIEDLHIVEVQLGSTLIEDDIERYGYYWE